MAFLSYTLLQLRLCQLWFGNIKKILIVNQDYPKIIEASKRMKE